MCISDDVVGVVNRDRQFFDIYGEYRKRHTSFSREKKLELLIQM